MATTTEQNPLAGIDLSEVNDGSTFAPGTEEAVAVAATAIKSDLKTALKASQSLTKMIFAVAYQSMVLSRSVINAAGYPIWSLATDKALQLTLTVLEGLYDEVFSIPDNASDEVKKELRNERAQNLSKVRLARSRVFVEPFTVDYVLKNGKFTDEQKADMLKPGTLKWSDSRKDYPEISYLQGDIPTYLKKQIGEHYKRSGLDVPEKFGGEPKDKNPQGTKDKKTSPDAFDKAACETQAGFTQLRAAQSLVNLTKTYVRAGLEAETITDRDEIEVELHVLAKVATLYAKHVHGNITETDRATLDSLVEIPDLMETIKAELAGASKS